MRWGALRGCHPPPPSGGIPACPRVPRRLEKEYTAIKNKEMEEQIEIKVGWVAVLRAP